MKSFFFIIFVSAAGSGMFIEHVDIPQSGHDILTSVSTHQRFKQKFRKYFKRKQDRRRLPFSNELFPPGDDDDEHSEVSDQI